MIRSLEDTACWAAIYRARETERADPLFRDPFARRLAGDRGERIASALPVSERHEWAWVTRTVLFDRFLADELARGADVVLSLAAGFDARPYRMDLRPGLRWIEVDRASIVARKNDTLRDAEPRCAIERVAVDLKDRLARRALFARVGGSASRVIVLSEGLLVYLAPDDVSSLAEDLRDVPGLRRWIVDIVSPGLLRMLRRTIGPALEGAGARFRFGPSAGPEFFARYGWRPLQVRSMLKAGAGLNRLDWWMRLLSFVPESSGGQGLRPWSAVCLLGRD